MRPIDQMDADDVGFLGIIAAVMLGVSLIAAGPTPVVLIALPGLVAFTFQGRLHRLPPELRLALVVVPIGVAVAIEPAVEALLFVPVTAVLYLAVEPVPRRRAAIITAVCAAAMPVIAVVQGDDRFGWSQWMFAFVLLFVLGLVLRRQRRLIAELAGAREELARQAVAEERRRIARELHDLAGHTLAAMLLHVTGARHVMQRDPGEASRALLDAEQVGRHSLDQIRATVAALRTDESGTDRPVAGAGDLRALIAEYGRAGLTIDAQVAPSIVDLDGPTGIALHRIARESLANVARHAPANRVEVSADVTEGEVRLTVADHGRRPLPTDAGGHFGLVGMAERARALGGSCTAGATADGWRVEARLPQLGPTADGRTS